MRALVSLTIVLTGCASLPNETDRTCTVDRAHYIGMAGLPYANACEREDDELRAAFEKGIARTRAETELARAEEAQKAERKRVAEDQSVWNHFVTGLNVISTGSTTPFADENVDEARRDVRDSTEGVTLSPGFTTPQMNFAVGLAAPLVGMTFGFGVGHTLQGRWREEGWKWTAIDMGLLVGSVVASRQCRLDEECWAPGLLLLGFIGARVFESIDLWSEFSRRTKLKMAPSAISSGGTTAPGLAAAFEF